MTKEHDIKEVVACLRWATMVLGDYPSPSSRGGTWMKSFYTKLAECEGVCNDIDRQDPQARKILEEGTTSVGS